VVKPGYACSFQKRQPICGEMIARLKRRGPSIPQDPGTLQSQGLEWASAQSRRVMRTVMAPGSQNRFSLYAAVSSGDMSIRKALPSHPCPGMPGMLMRVWG